jgi:hypothetical protein
MVRYLIFGLLFCAYSGQVLAAMLVLLCSIASGAIINFETTPTGGTPVDDAVFSGSYVDGTTTVTFGIDSNSDLVIDTDVFFEQRGENPLDAYGSNTGGIFLGEFDRDDSGTGGEFFLRPGAADGNPGFSSLNTGEAFLIVYSSILPTSASGSLWDVDDTEVNTVKAFDSSKSLLQTITLTAADGGDSLPASFSFSSLSTPIAFIQITNGAGPLGFDNFDATQPIPVEDADFDEDLDVDGADFLTWQRNLGIGTMLSEGDANSSGTVDAADLAIWESQFGTITSTAVVASVVVPEPGSIFLAAIASLVGGYRRRRI